MFGGQQVTMRSYFAKIDIAAFGEQMKRVTNVIYSWPP